MKPENGLHHEPRSGIMILAGPTGSGKSALAELLCRSGQFPACEIITADSRQIYCGMDIGTDKPSAELRRSIPHHLVDILNPDQRFSAADFARKADQCIRRITQNDALPLVVGGTGLYLRVLVGGLADLIDRATVIREELKEKIRLNGLDTLYAGLQQLDPDRARAIHPKDAFRIIRALEILQCGSEKASEILSRHAFQKRKYRVLFFVLNVPRANLYKRIDARVDRMIGEGLIREVRSLVVKYGPDAPGLSAIGYRQVLKHLSREITRNEAARLIKRDTRRFSKRQLTWFRKESDAIWIDHDPDHPESTVDIIVRRLRAFLDG
ncbi:tRNA (adenosine(37)-N6)-dimethylallyltransferase MiaA [bacterium]|nr:tRNA (adenosine(37)-N6)-dimethylallyltransferase MiaA [candidate division CSSED10-310 bacterium]